MSELTWQKSTFSGGPQGNCLFIATAPDGTIRLRESDEPRTVIVTAGGARRSAGSRQGTEGPRAT